MKKVSFYSQPDFRDKLHFNSVMIIDDDEICHAIFIKNIEFTAFAKKVISLKNGREALEVLRSCFTGEEEFPEIIFLDINMPIMNGWAFLEEYKKLPREPLENTKVVMLTSSNSPVDIEQALTNAPIFDYIEKPINLAKLELLRKKINAGKD